MRPLLVLVLVLAAIGALLFAVFRIDSGGPKTDVAPPVAEAPPAKPRGTAPLEGSAQASPDRVPTARSEDRAVAGSAAIVLDNRLTGLVRNPQGQPVVGAEVILTTLNTAEMFFVNDPLPDMTREPRARTDGDGRYTFLAIEPRDRYMLVLSHPDYARKEEPTLSVAESGVSEMPPITMGPGATLSGHVRNKAGDMVRGAALFLEGTSYDGLGIAAPDRMSATSDASGGFQFKNVAKGARFLTASAPGYAQITIRNLHFDKEETVVRDVTLDVAEQICGRVVGPGNVGVAEAIVIAVGVSSVQQTSRAQVVTNQNGEFCFENLASGPYNIIASAKGWRMVSRNNRVETNTSNHMIEMLQEASLAGRVIEAGTGKPVTSFTARVRVHYGPGTPTAPYNEDTFPTNDPDGLFRIPGVPAGDFVVEAWAPGFAPGFSTNFTVAPGNPVSGIVVQLDRGGSISGRLVDAEGKPIPRAKVTSRDNEWTDDEFTRALGFTYPTNATQVEVRSGDDGRFTLQNLSPELYVITVEGAGFTQFQRRDIRVNQGADTALGDIRLNRGGIVRGTVFDASGKPLVGGTINLRITDGDVPRSYSTRSGEGGRFQVVNVAPGRYFLSAMRTSSGDANPFETITEGENSKQRIVVDEGQTTTQDLHLPE